MTVLAILILAPIAVFGLVTYAAYHKGCECEDCARESKPKKWRKKAALRVIENGR